MHSSSQPSAARASTFWWWAVATTVSLSACGGAAPAVYRGGDHHPPVAEADEGRVVPSVSRGSERGEAEFACQRVEVLQSSADQQLEAEQACLAELAAHGIYDWDGESPCAESTTDEAGAHPGGPSPCLVAEPPEVEHGYCQLP